MPHRKPIRSGCGDPTRSGLARRTPRAGVLRRTPGRAADPGGGGVGYEAWPVEGTQVGRGVVELVG